MARILVIGSANMDMVAPIERMPVPGETILIGDVTLTPGGKGANTAVAAARMGASVRFVGCVGGDAFGASLRTGLMQDGIDCTHLRISPRRTGTAIILLNHLTGQNAIMVGAAANQEVTLPADATLFEQTDAVMLQLETPVAVNIEAVARARAAGVRVVLDPAPAVDHLPDELLGQADLVSPNESELAALTGRPVRSVDEAVVAARQLINRGVRELVVKLGEKGALWMTPQSHELFPPVPVQAVDTTAAGDAFTATLTVGLADGLPMPQAIRRACLAGALTCTKLGARSSIPTAQDLEHYAP